MTMYEVTSWTNPMKKKLEKSFEFFAEGATYRHDYVISFASETEMYKKMLKGIKDSYGKDVNIQYYRKASKKKKNV